MPPSRHGQSRICAPLRAAIEGRTRRAKYAFGLAKSKTNSMVRDTWQLPSKTLRPGTEIEFVRPGRTGLLVQPHEVLRDLLGLQDLVALEPFGDVGVDRADERAVDRTVDDDVRHVNAERPKLARHALGQRA